MRQVKMENGRLAIQFSSKKRTEFYELLELIKCGLKDRIYSPKNRTWYAANTPHNRKILSTNGFDISAIKEEDVEEILSFDPSSVLIDTRRLKGLMPYQIDGIKFLVHRKGNALLADEMGLGKTVQAIGFAQISDKKAVLVVCPASVKYSWNNEVKKWANKTACVLSGRKPYTFKQSQFTVINYDISHSWKEKLKARDFDLIIADESQYLGNNNTQRTSAFKEISKRIESRIFLSGTPINNRPAEFFTVLNMLDKVAFPNRWRYMWEYCDPKHNGFGWVFNGATNIEKLKTKIAPLMLRRKKQEVLKDLPKKITTLVPLESDSMDAYNKRLMLFRSNAQDLDSIEIKSSIEELKIIAYKVKRKAVFGWVKDFISTGNKLVLFAVHTKVINEIVEEFRDVCVFIDGRVSAEERQVRIDAFQKDSKIKLFVGQLVAASTGITLTAATATAFVEFGWNAAIHKQAEDRIHRIGQKADCVFSYYLMAKDTIDERIVDIIQSKNKVLSELIDGKETAFFDNSKMLKDITRHIQGD